MTFWFSDKVKIQCVVFIAVLTPIILYISDQWSLIVVSYIVYN